MAVDETVVAYHEAGHAVAAFDQHLRYKYISIIPDDKGTFGRVLLSLHPDDSIFHIGYLNDSGRLYFERRIVTYFAGYVAEAKHQDIELDFEGEYGADWENALEHAHFACGSFTEELAFAEWLFHRTVVMFKISHNWKMVEALAAELIKQKKIGYQASRKIMRDAARFPKLEIVDGKIVVPRKITNRDCK